jgi:hypothetical protein
MKMSVAAHNHNQDARGSQPRRRLLAAGEHLQASCAGQALSPGKAAIPWLSTLRSGSADEPLPGLGRTLLNPEGQQADLGWTD